jgi:sugar (pentulose or hexulose) kinase
VLGLDLGTSQVKALLCAPDETVLGQEPQRRMHGAQQV